MRRELADFLDYWRLERRLAPLTCSTYERAGGAELDPQLALRVCNPSPEAHDRARSFLGSDIDSDYRGTGVWGA